MNTISKKAFSLLVILVFSAAMAGCSDRSTEDFIGRWKAVKITQDDVVYVEEIEEYGLEIIYNLKEDKTFSGLLGDVEVNGTYRVNDSKILFTYENGETDSFTLEGSELIGEAGDMNIVLEKQ